MRTHRNLKYIIINIYFTDEISKYIYFKDVDF